MRPSEAETALDSLRRSFASVLSAVNTRRADELIKAGRMQPAGLRAYEARDPAKSGGYSFEQRQTAKLSPAHERQVRANRKAWTYFESQPPGYRRTVTWWVESAKRDETRARRLQILIDDCAAGRRILPMRRPER